MGKKLKTGKSRQDKYYKLAKETGYRSRAAFKLIQLNRKFSFLQTSRVVLDLCAAPGGWLQVAAQNTPLSSIIVGIDLVPIINIRRVTTIQGDITTEKCAAELKKVLNKWKVDTVLHDGSPNVGQNYIQDAYQQAILTLAALKLATVYLKKGGWFVTKMFRSRDYNSIMWVLQQLFKDVHTTKPQASRMESAEIYIVCQNYLAPDRIDKKFLDIKHVFSEVDQDRTKLPQLDLKKPDVITKHRQGYPDGATLLYHTMTAKEFFTCSNHLERLADVTQITFDDSDEIAEDESTTSEIRILCEDIKVLNKRDISNLLKWRKAYLKIKEDQKAAAEKSKDKVTTEMDSEAEEAQLDMTIENFKLKQARDEKLKLKKTKKEKVKLKKQMAKSKEAIGDSGNLDDDLTLFNLKRIKSGKELNKVVEGDLTMLDPDYNDMAPYINRRPAPTTIDKETKEYMEETDDDISGDESDDYMATDEVEITEKVNAKNKKNPLMLDLENKKTRTERLTSEWFSKDSFAGIEDERDGHVEIDKMVEDFKKKGGKLIDIKKPKKRAARENDNDSENEDITIAPDDIHDDTTDKQRIDPDDSDTDSDVEEDDRRNAVDLATRLVKEAQANNAATPVPENSSKKGKKAKNIQANGFEIVPVMQQPLPTSLDEVGLALGAAIATSRKRRREIIEDGYNRYMFDDLYLPTWFSNEEQRHRARPLPITKAEVQEYRDRQKEIDARPIKKIAEAKARKKRRETLRLMKARKRAESLADTEDTSEKEKWSQIKQIYKKAGLLTKKKREVTYVVAKKAGSKKVARPKGVKGPYKVVDARAKKDKKNTKEKSRKKRPHHSRR